MLFDRIKEWMNLHPRKTVIALMVILFVNFLGVLIYTVLTYEKVDTIEQQTAREDHNDRDNIGLIEQEMPRGNTLMFDEFRKVSKLKDSLEMLMEKGITTREDTLLFLRIVEQYRKVDPTIDEDFKKIDSMTNN